MAIRKTKVNWSLCVV